jgi:hypothetical protein
MSDSSAAYPERAFPTVPNPAQLVEQTRDVAASIYSSLSEEYLSFRRHYYHESNPSIETAPPSSDEKIQTETARLAQRTLQFMPREVHAIPLVRELLDHLQWVHDIHTISEHERTTLNNFAMVLLHGVEDGIQPWLVDWLAEAEQRLQQATDRRYYLAFPWQGLLYRNPGELAAFEAAVRAGDISSIEHEVERLANGLITALRDPLGTQPELVFSGPDGERNKALFQLETTAGLALGAYLAADQLHNAIQPRQPQPALHSVIQPLPSAIVAHLMPENT